MTITRFITVGKKTAEHKANLEAKGYEVVENEGVLEIQASEVIEGTVDLSTPEKQRAILAKVIKTKAVFSYKTTFIFADGKVLYGVPACSKLGKKTSCLVTNSLPKQSKGGLDDIFDTIV